MFFVIIWRFFLFSSKFHHCIHIWFNVHCLFNFIVIINQHCALTRVFGSCTGFSRVFGGCTVSTLVFLKNKKKIIISKYCYLCFFFSPSHFAKIISRKIKSQKFLTNVSPLKLILKLLVCKLNRIGYI